MASEASLLAWDGFDNYVTAGPYPNDTLVGQGPAKPGFSGNWGSSDTYASFVYPRVDSGTLTYAGLPTRDGQVTMFRSMNPAQDKTVTRSLSGIGPSLPETLYISFLVNFTPGYNGWTLQSASRNPSLGNQGPPRPFGFTLNSNGTMTLFGAASPTVTTGSTLSANTTHLVVLKLENNVDPAAPMPGFGGDRLSLYVDPDLSSEGANSVLAFTSDNNSNFYVSNNASWILSPLSVTFNPADGDSLTFDEFRIATTWAAISVPEPSTALALLVGFVHCLACGRRRRRIG